MTKALLLDFDGIIRIIPPKEPGDTSFIIPAPAMCEERMKRVVKVCEDTGAKIVVTSDWRRQNNYDQTNNRDEIEAMLAPHIPWSLMHTDWCTDVWSFRWREVQRWLEAHPEVTEYAILEDMKIHFRDAPEDMKRRIVWCNNRHGLIPELLPALYNTLDPIGEAAVIQKYSLPAPVQLTGDLKEEVAPEYKDVCPECKGSFIRENGSNCYSCDSQGYVKTEKSK